MQLVGEKVAPDQPTLSTLIASATTTATTQPKAAVSRETGEYVHRAAWKAGVMGALNLAAIILAVRLVLLVAVIGALYLAKIALDVPATLQMPALIMLAIYCATTVIPLVWLASRK
jgi:hypothetical protein